MNTKFLSDAERAQVESIMAEFGLNEFDASVRLWGRGKSIEVSGTLGKTELSCLLAIARYLGEPVPVSGAALPHAVVAMPGATLHQAAA